MVFASTHSLLLFGLLIVSFCVSPTWVNYLFYNPALFVPSIFRSPSAPYTPPATVQPACTYSLDSKMSWFQKQFTLPTKSRGSYLVTDHVVQNLPEIKDYKVGLLNLFVQHTSCALSLNENWDEDVREDMSDALDRYASLAVRRGSSL